MKFNEAMEELLKGKKIRHKKWFSNCFVYFKNGEIYNQNNDFDSITISTDIDLIMDSWEIYKPEKEKLEEYGKRWFIEMSCRKASNCSNCEIKSPKLYKKCKEHSEYIMLSDYIRHLKEYEVDDIYKEIKNEL